MERRYGSWAALRKTIGSPSRTSAACSARGGMLPRDERLGPRHHQRGDVIELERGALDQRGQVLHSPGEYLLRALLEPAGAADEPGDGVDAKPGGGDGRPLRRSRVVRADDQHEWTDPGALPRGPWAHEIPQLLPALGGGGTHQP